MVICFGVIAFIRNTIRLKSKFQYLIDISVLKSYQ